MLAALRCQSDAERSRTPDAVRTAYTGLQSQGLQNKEIVLELTITECTLIKFYVSSILSKLAAMRTASVRIAAQRGTMKL